MWQCGGWWGWRECVCEDMDYGKASQRFLVLHCRTWAGLDLQTAVVLTGPQASTLPLQSGTEWQRTLHAVWKTHIGYCTKCTTLLYNSQKQKWNVQNVPHQKSVKTRGRLAVKDQTTSQPSFSSQLHWCLLSVTPTKSVRHKHLLKYPKLPLW